jgi:transglutaminase-like putative cysteine protease
VPQSSAAPVILEVEHVTTYRYARPVRFGEHSLMFRPRPGHDIRVLDSSVHVSPESDLRWMLDVFDNSVTHVQPRSEADTLRIACRFAIVHEAVDSLELPLAPHAERYPFDYSADERRDLGPLLEPHYPDPDGRLYWWLRQFFNAESRPRMRELLFDMTNAIKSQFSYAERDEEGTQSPHETLEKGSGTCRDFALLLMEAARRLGLAARFVSGYLYDPALDAERGGDPTAGELRGAGATHAWVHIYLPGAGWVGFDPTNSSIPGGSLIRVAFARDPSQALPLSGTWFGKPGDYLGMSVEVKVRRKDASSSERM